MKHISEFLKKYEAYKKADERDLYEKIFTILEEKDFEIDSLKDEIRRLNKIIDNFHG